MGLTRTAIQRPVFILMLMVAAMLLGFISYNSMRVEQNPEVNFGTITVSVAYPGAGPEEVNNLVARKIEEAVSGVNGIREVTSTSREGIATVSAVFELETDINVAMNDVRSKVDAITGELPRDALKPQVFKFDMSSQPLLFIAFSSDKMSSRELRDEMDEKIQDRFAQIPGVAAATVSGGESREIQVQVSKDKLLAYGIGINDVQRAIQNANINVPGGRVVTNEQEYSVRLQAEFQNIEDVRNMVFSVRDPGQFNASPKVVRLRDVATILDASEERTQYARLDGADTVVLGIQKVREGNAIEITKVAKDLLAQVQKQYADQGLQSEIVYEEAKYIQESIHDLIFALLFGIFLVALTVYVFLHNFRGMLIVAIAIPLCIFVTFIALKAFGFTINNMSMLALSLAIGVLVDDAIVVLENIYRHLQKGEAPVEAAINGRSEIGLAAIAITTVDVVVFLPIAFMGGIVGQFFKPLALAFVFAVLSSLFVSFTVTPMLAARWYRRGENVEHPTGRFASWFERMFDGLRRSYGRTLQWALAHRWFVFISGNLALVAVFMFIGGSFMPDVESAVGMATGLFMAALAVGVLVFIVNIFRGHVKPKFLLSGALFGLAFPVAALIGFGYAQWKQEAVFKFQFMPESDQGQVSISIQLPPGANLEATERVVEYVEKKVAQHPDTKYVRSDLGTQSGGWGGGGNTGSNYAQVSVTLNDKEAFMDRLSFGGPSEKLRRKAASAVAADMLEAIKRYPGADIKVSASDSGFGAPIQMTLISDNRDQLVATATKIKEGLQSGVIKGVINPDVSARPGKPELKARPIRERMADAGLTPAEVGAAMRTLYQGNEDAKLRESGREYPIRVMLNRADRDNPEILQQVPVKFENGRPVLLGQIATVSAEPGVDKIDRRDRQEEIRITADLLPGFAAGSVQSEINQWLDREKLIPEEVRKRELGQADAQAREGQYLFGALFLGFLLVYMVLASLYDNLLYPAIIQLAQPQAMVGALLALILTDKALNIVGMIGIIVLVGLVGKNAILLVDYTNTLRERGRSRHDALVEAGPVRLRPIAMTTLALVVGTLPVALAIGRGSEFRETIGITIIGGITLSTLLTLVVIPCSYTIFDDLSLWTGRTLQRLLGKLRPGERGEGDGSLPHESEEQEERPAAGVL